MLTLWTASMLLPRWRVKGIAWLSHRRRQKPCKGRHITFREWQTCVSITGKVVYRHTFGQNATCLKVPHQISLLGLILRLRVRYVRFSWRPVPLFTGLMRVTFFLILEMGG